MIEHKVAEDDSKAIILFRKIGDFHKNDLREEVKKIIALLLMDYAQKFDETEVRHLVDRVCEVLTRKYRYWPLNDFNAACERGKLGLFNGANTSKVTVRLIEQWLWQYSEQRQKTAADERVREGLKEKAADKHRHPDSDVYADAMQWKMKRADMFRAAGNWDECPVRMVVDAMKMGTIDKLESEIFL